MTTAGEIRLDNTLLPNLEVNITQTSPSKDVILQDDDLLYEGDDGDNTNYRAVRFLVKNSCFGQKIVPRCPRAQMPSCPHAQMPTCPRSQMPMCPDAQVSHIYPGPPCIRSNLTCRLMTKWRTRTRIIIGQRNQARRVIKAEKDPSPPKPKSSKCSK